MEVLCGANSIQDKLIAEAVFDALREAFQSISRPEASTKVQNKTKVVEQLRSLLFQPRYAASGENLRTKRARAMSELAKLGWDGLVGSVFGTELKDEIASEPIESVRAILQQAYVLARED
jgi:hypothetical protein